MIFNKTGVYLILITIVSCGIRPKNDIYNKVPLGSKLNKEILFQAKQIIPYNSELIIVYDISEKWDEFSPHLLFFNNERKLYAATFLPSDKIDSIKSGILYASLFEDRNRRKDQYRQDLPKTYKMRLYDDNEERSLNISNKLIDSIKFQPQNKNKVTLYFRKATNLFAGVGYQPTNADSIIFKDFVLYDTTSCPLSEILINNKRKIIYRKYKDSLGTTIRDEMILKSGESLDKMILSLLNSK